MFRRRFVTTFGLFLVLLLATSTAFAKGEKDFEPVTPRRVATVNRDGEIETIVTQQYSGSVTSVIGPTSVSETVNGQTVEYSNCVGSATNGSYTYHCFGRTRRTVGSGNYRTHVHSTLIRGDHDDVAYGDEQVFNYLLKSCAQDERPNATSESCRSDNFNSSSGLWWYVLSAHKFDTDLSNPWDTNCSGCMDWKYETP